MFDYFVTLRAQGELMKKKIIFVLLLSTVLVFAYQLLPTRSLDPYALFRKSPYLAQFLAKCEQTQSNVPRTCTKEETKKYAEMAKQLFNFQGVVSQSDGHLQKNACVAWDNIMAIVSNPAYKAVFDEALAYERSVVNDRAVFYHAQQNIYYWLELLYTKLWERKYNQAATHYLFLRFPDEQSREIIAAELQKGEITRKHWLLHGRQEVQTADEISPVILSTNYALFANSKNHLCSTARFFLHDFNDIDPKISTKDVLAKFSNNNLYERYKPYLDELEREFKKAVPQSVLLQILLPFHLLKDHTYFSMQGSYKTSIYLYDKTTDDVYTIINTLKTNPAAFSESDIPVISIIVTPDSLHALRKEGAEIRVHGCFNNEKLNQVIHKLEKVIDLIAQENPDAFTKSPIPFDILHPLI